MNRFGGIAEPGHTRALALILCEKGIIDAQTGQKSVVGTFSGLVIPQAPIIFPGLSIYTEIEKGDEDINEFYVGIFSPTGESVVQSTTKIQNWGNGLAELLIRVPPFPLPIAGDYAVQLFSAERVLLERKLAVQIAPPPQEEEAGSPIP